jgi:hypothetical protein
VEFFTTRNLVILALFQIGTIVAGVLGAGAAIKWHWEVNFNPSPDYLYWPRVIADYGFALLLLPLIWAVIALRTIRRPGSSDASRIVSVASGFLLLFVLIVCLWNVSLGQVFRLIVGADSF